MGLVWCTACVHAVGGRSDARTDDRDGICWACEDGSEFIHNLNEEKNMMHHLGGPLGKGDYHPKDPAKPLTYAEKYEIKDPAKLKSFAEKQHHPKEPWNNSREVEEDVVDELKTLPCYRTKCEEVILANDMDHEEKLQEIRAIKIARALDVDIVNEVMEDEVMDEDWANAKKHLDKFDYVGMNCEEITPAESPVTITGYPNPLFLHDKLCKAGKAIMMKKNHDYTGGSGDPYANFRGSTALGIGNIKGILLRVQDKMMRIKTFEEKGQLLVQDEGIDDALIDVINYMVLIAGLVKEIQDAEEKSSCTCEVSQGCKRDVAE